MADLVSPVVELRDVSKRYKRFGASFVLEDVSLDAFEGERVLITGPSGGGKTTLLNMIGGIDRPTTGRIRVAGNSIARMREGARAKWRARSVGFVFQHHLLPRGLKAWEAVAMPLLWGDEDFSRESAHERAVMVLQEAGLGEQLDSRVEHLSGGQRQRVALARALASNPPVVLADEPTSNLDRNTGRAIVDLLGEWAGENGTTLIVVSHEGGRTMWEPDSEYRVEEGRVERAD